MNKLYSLAFLLLTVLTVNGQVLLTENFSYPADSLLQNNGWYGHSAATTNPIKVTSTGLSWSTTPYLGSGIGNAAAVNNTGADENRPFSSYPTSGNVYASFLLRVNGVVSTVNSGFFFHLGEYTNVAAPIFTSTSTAFRARTFIVPGPNPGQYKLGLSFNSSSVGGDTTLLNLDTAQTYLVVVKYQIVTGALNDSVSLYVFTDGSNITNEPATPAIGPLAGTGSDLNAVQMIALRQYAATQNITVDGIIARDSWNLLAPTLSGSNLISPPNGTFLNVNGPNTTTTNLLWSSARNASAAPSYTWQLANRAAGNFNNPLLSLTANNSGADTSLTLNYGQLNTALASLSVAIGDTVAGVWRIRTIAGADTAYSNSFNIDIRRGTVTVNLTNFNLLTPPNFTILPVTGSGSQTTTIRWSTSSAGSQAVTYQWLAIAPGGNFNSPVVSLVAGNAGSDTSLILSYTAIDALLASLNFNVGDSVYLDWTIRATSGASTQLALQTRRITLFRGGLSQPMTSPILLNPVNNTLLNVNGPSTNATNISWRAARNNNLAVSYTWQLASRASGTFNTPLLSIAANSGGADTSLTLSFAQLNAALISLNVVIGDTVFGNWRVRAVSANDTTFSNVFAIDIRRGSVVYPITAFSPLTPANATILPITGAGAQTVSIRWTAATAGPLPISYAWLAIAPGGNFNTPTVTLPAGSDTSLLLTYTAIDALLASLNFNIGDSVYLDWTIRATAGTTTQLATQIRRITLFRGGLGTQITDTLSAFALLSPATNTTLSIQGAPTQTANLSWQASAASLNAATTSYTWLLDVPTGNFSSPVLAISAGNATSLSLIFGAIADSLTAKGVAVGSSFVGKWTIRASSDTLLRFANVPFNITLTRGVMTSVAENTLSSAIAIYPNPASDFLTIQLPAALQNELQISIINSTGQEISRYTSLPAADGIQIKVDALANGLYFVKVQSNTDMAIKRLLIQR